MKYFLFGAGVSLCLLLAAWLVYGIVAVNAGDADQNEDSRVEAVQAPFNLAQKARADLINTDGEKIGEAHFQQSNAGVLIMLEASWLPPGLNAVHLHSKRDCTPVGQPDDENPVQYFTNAGDHIALGEEAHGFMNSDGPHAGDLPNIYTSGGDGPTVAHMLNDRVTLSDTGRTGVAPLFDPDGSAIIIHEGRDNYSTPFTGKAGGRIACGEIVQE